jgi:hypothetical protein
MNLIINLTNDETEILPLDTAASLASFGIGQSLLPLCLSPLFLWTRRMRSGHDCQRQMSEERGDCLHV